MDNIRWDQKTRFCLIALQSEDNNYTQPTTDGNVYATKNLWALGNYSLFVRPGYKRIALTGADDLGGLMGTAYFAPDNSKVVAVYVNMANDDKDVRTEILNLDNVQPLTHTMYLTNANNNLKNTNITSIYNPETVISIPARSVVAFVYNLQSQQTTKIGQAVTGITNESAMVCPNPIAVGGNLTIQLPENTSGCFTLSLYSMQGNKVYTGNGYCKEGVEKLTLPANLSQGIYFLKIQYGDKMYSNKLIIN
jgi:hypothetical protein